MERSKVLRLTARSMSETVTTTSVAVVASGEVKGRKNRSSISTLLANNRVPAVSRRWISCRIAPERHPTG